MEELLVKLDFRPVVQELRVGNLVCEGDGQSGQGVVDEVNVEPVGFRVVGEDGAFRNLEFCI